MIKALFTKWFNQAIAPFNKRLADVEEKVDTGYTEVIEQTKSFTGDKPNTGSPGITTDKKWTGDKPNTGMTGLRATKKVRKPLITKTQALKNLKEYIKGYEDAKGMAAGRGIGSELEFYERNNKVIQTKELRGTAAIDAFIVRAKADEVRLVRQVR